MRRRRGLYRATLRSIFRHSHTTCAWHPRWSRLQTWEDAGREWPRCGCNRFVAGCNRESSQNRLQVATQSKSRLAGGCVTVSKLDNTKSCNFKSRPVTGRVEATLLQLQQADALNSLRLCHVRLARAEAGRRLAGLEALAHGHQDGDPEPLMRPMYSRRQAQRQAFVK